MRNLAAANGRSATPALIRSANAADETNASSSQKSWPERAGQAATSLELQRALRVHSLQRVIIVDMKNI